MRIKLKGMMAGPGGCFMAGEIVDVSDIVGVHLIDSKQAELAECHGEDSGTGSKHAEPDEYRAEEREPEKPTKGRRRK